MSVKLGALEDTGRSPFERIELAAEFTRQLDAHFAGKTRLPRRRMHQLMFGYDEVVHEQLLPSLVTMGLRYLTWDDLGPAERANVRRRFHQSCYALLTPMAVDSTHPVPRLATQEINLGVLVDGRLVYVTVPTQLARLIALPGPRYLSIESVIAAMLPELLAGAVISEYSPFRITRNRTTGAVTRLEIEHGASGRLLKSLISQLGVTDDDVYFLRSPKAMGDGLTVNGSSGRIGFWKLLPAQ